MTFENHHDAKRVLEVLGKRLERYGLTLHPDKTRFIDFRPQRSRWHASRLQGTTVRLSRLHPHLGKVAEGQERGAANDGEEPPRPRAGSGQRLVSGQPPPAAALTARPSVCEDARPLRLLRRHGEHVGSCGGIASQVTRLWRKWLERRTRSKRLTWNRFNAFLEPPPATSQPGSSIATPPSAKLSREEPDAGNLHVRVCGG